MDFNEFELKETGFNPDIKYSEDVEFVIEQLNEIAHAACRYSRSVQIPKAIHIIKKLNEMRALANER